MCVCSGVGLGPVGNEDLGIFTWEFRASTQVQSGSLSLGEGSPSWLPILPRTKLDIPPFLPGLGTAWLPLRSSLENFGERCAQTSSTIRGRGKRRGNGEILQPAGSGSLGNRNCRDGRSGGRCSKDGQTKTSNVFLKECKGHNESIKFCWCENGCPVGGKAGLILS